GVGGDPKHSAKSGCGLSPTRFSQHSSIDLRREAPPGTGSAHRLLHEAKASLGHYNVLFLSKRNTARSIFAEAVMNRVGGQNFKGFSAGMHPAKELDPLVPEILRLARYPTDVLARLRPRRRVSARFRFHLVRSGCRRAGTALAWPPRHRRLALFRSGKIGMRGVGAPQRARRDARRT